MDEARNETRTSRRAVLTAVAAAGAATVVNALAKPLPVAAAGNDGAAVTVGGFYPDARSQTTLANATGNQAVLWVASNDDDNGFPGEGAGTAITGFSEHGVGVKGFSNTDGVGVLGSSVSSTGWHFGSVTGSAIRVEGKASFSRSGKVSVPKSRSYVDITVPGGLASTAAVIATLQYPRGTTAVAAARINYPSAGKARIYLTKVASTTAATPLAWFVLG